MTELLLTCPNCEAELRLPPGAHQVTCDQCQARLHVEAQFAYARGLAAFEEGQEIMGRVSPRRRRMFNHPDDRQAMDLFKEAYSALQYAFEGYLQEDQRQLGVEMMASMGREFAARLMVSELEASYWSMLMVELTAQNEYDSLQEKLSRPAAHPLMRLRWNLRRSQLRRKLAELGQKIDKLERQIAFIEIPHARNRAWTFQE